MTRVVLLDSGPLGMLTHPRPTRPIVAWLATPRRGGTIVRVPEIADYEFRRELLRANRTEGLDRLDALGLLLGYEPVTGNTLRLAAEPWAETRRRGRPTAPDAALDADVILAAQARLVGIRGDVVTVATGNVGHLVRFVDARDWQDIS